ncbi:MAG: serine hydrolase [Gammaproteobacteria bacterium]|nr:serine hydrolase [Gammaproteobacteria bacterium]
MHGSPSVLVASAFLAAHVTVPDTSAGSAFSAWLTAFNTADREQLRAVMKQFREPHPVEGALDFRRATGGFDLKKVLESTPTRIRVLVQERDGDQMAEGQMEKDEDTPNLAKGYTGRNGPLRYNYDSRPMRGSPAGGGFSTCEDLLRFAAALTGHKLLDAEHTKLLTTGKRARRATIAMATDSESRTTAASAASAMAAARRVSMRTSRSSPTPATSSR